MDSGAGRLSSNETVVPFMYFFFSSFSSFKSRRLEIFEFRYFISYYRTKRLTGNNPECIIWHISCIRCEHKHVGLCGTEFSRYLYLYRLTFFEIGKVWKFRLVYSNKTLGCLYFLVSFGFLKINLLTKIIIGCLLYTTY